MPDWMPLLFAMVFVAAILGCIGGFLMATINQWRYEKKAIKEGKIILAGDIYVLGKFTEEGDFDR